MMATVPYVTSDLGLRKIQADGFLLTRVYTSVKYQAWMIPNFQVHGQGVAKSQLFP